MIRVTVFTNVSNGNNSRDYDHPTADGWFWDSSTGLLTIRVGDEPVAVYAESAVQRVVDVALNRPSTSTPQ